MSLYTANEMIVVIVTTTEFHFAIIFFLPEFRIEEFILEIFCLDYYGIWSPGPIFDFNFLKSIVCFHYIYLP